MWLYTCLAVNLAALGAASDLSLAKPAKPDSERIPFLGGHCVAGFSGSAYSVSVGELVSILIPLSRVLQGLR